ncbi:unnamed protein product [Phaedon cochleariae]|uniref:MSP domain-containing protein n=1 Tax=Phaedon cochleariae TaxID=80249 RepID=A0A9N9SB77_PHACE|nr:unnamed protein product [Phaedon cochleariae]
MVLTNPSDKKVLFKIKTTAPKKYCVRPNSGVMAPNGKSEIAISLQPFLFDPAEKNKHKFMVQTVFAPDGEFNLDQLWKEITPEQLMDSKLKCVFEMPEEPQASEGVAGIGAGEEAKGGVKGAGGQGVAEGRGGEPGGGSDGAELQKAAQEVSAIGSVQQLRQEEMELRQENLKLKEEILQLKRQVGVGASSAARPTPANRYAPPAQPEQALPVAYIALAVVLSLLSVLLGKFAL